MYRHTIRRESSADGDVRVMLDSFYDLDSISGIRRLAIGDSNFNYIVKTARGDRYFAQLYSTSKTLPDLRYEVALRKWYNVHRRGRMLCAEPIPTTEGDVCVSCELPEIGRERFFTLWQFLEGHSPERAGWACGKMTEELIRATARGVALYHLGAYGFVPPCEDADAKMSYENELKEYRRVFTDGYELKKGDRKDPYILFFEAYRPRLLELLDRCTELYLQRKGQLPHCICQGDTSPQNYLFDETLSPIGICDLDISRELPRLFDLCWFISEGLCRFDERSGANSIDPGQVRILLDAYDEAITEAGGGKPGPLTPFERETLMDLFPLVAIHMGFYYQWDYILHDNPTATTSFNLYWGRWTKSALEYVEEHRDLFVF